MNKLLTKGQLSVLIVFGVLIIDQIIKILVKTNMFWHESIRITDWFYIYFTENNGMAFGMELFGKLFLTTFRIVAVGLIIWYLAKIIKENYKTGYIVCLYFPIIETNWPEWIPGIGGEHFIFFSPIFNFADAAISCGIIALLLFYGKYLNTGIHPEEKAQKKDAQ